MSKPRMLFFTTDIATKKQYSVTILPTDECVVVSVDNSPKNCVIAFSESQMRIYSTDRSGAVAGPPLGTIDITRQPPA